MLRSLTLVQAAQALDAGEVIAYPTEGVWGLGCNPYDEAAMRRLLMLKGRPVEKGVILLAASTSQLQGVVALSPKDLASLTATTQATTWLVPFIETALPPWITGKHSLLAVRISQHPVVQALCNQTQRLLVSTSANTAGSQAARTAFQVRRYFPDVPLCQGRVGRQNTPSTIIDYQTGRIIRR